MWALIVAATLAGGCASTVEGVKQDTEKVAEKTADATQKAAEKTAGAANTVDVKSALIADKRVDASNINVDTSASSKTVVLKGTVPTAEQVKVAEEIARENADGYRITNQLTVKATK
jgi:osmotically-inducible protein OsmY